MSVWPHVIWATFIVCIVTALLGAIAQTDHADGQCTGLGFGCTIPGADLAAFAAMYIVPVALVVLAIGHAVIAIVQSLRRPRRPIA